MKILVTGASGLIGSHLVPALKKRGHEVITRARGDHSPIPAIDGVVNLAGEPIMQSWTEAAKKRIYSSRVDGTRDLINRLPAIKFFISASAVGIYGSRGDEILTETSAEGAGFLADVCRTWESETLERHDLKARKAVLRIAPVLGREGGMLAKMLLPFKLGMGGRIGSGQHWMSWIHIDDIVAMFVQLIENSSLEGAFIGSAPEPVTNSDFTQTLARTLKRPAFMPMPLWALKLIFGEMSSVMVESQRSVPKRFIDSGFSFQHQTLESALQDLLK